METIGCSSVLKQKGLDIATGVLLPDDAVNNIMKEYLLQKDNYILDGYPRTLQQNDFMQDFCVPDLVVVLDISEEEVVNRATGRRICEKCGDIYNLNGFKIPQKEGICDKCGGELLHRDDDKEETVRRRYREYVDKTYPVVGAYKYKKCKTIVWEFDVLAQSTADIAKTIAEYINYEMN